MIVGCEPVSPPVQTPPQTTEPEKPKEAPVSEAVRQYHVKIGNLISLAAKAGALHRCRETGLFKADPDLVEDTYYRLRGIFLSMRRADPDGEGNDIAMMSYIAYTLALQQGVIRLVEVPTHDNPKAKFKISEVNLSTPAQCVDLSVDVNKAREKGGPLDVAPHFDDKRKERA